MGETLFEEIRSALCSLITCIELGDIGLPELTTPMRPHELFDQTRSCLKRNLFALRGATQ